MDILHFSLGFDSHEAIIAVISIEGAVIAYLYTKLVESKNDQIQAAKDENERNKKISEDLQRTTLNILSYIRTYHHKNSDHKKT